MAIDTFGSSPTSDLQNLPDLVLDKILRLLPTKAAVGISFLSKQWQDVTSSFRVLDLDENGDNKRQKAQNLDLLIENQHHNKFINFLDGYLEYRETYDRKAVLDKLRLYLRMFLVSDFTTITNWLNYAFERGVKDLDINLELSSRRSPWEIFNCNNCYCLPWVTFTNANFLTSLNLECMRITDIRKDYIPSHDNKHLLPSLETMSFASIWFDDEALSSLLRECPAIKNLSITGCWFCDGELHVSSSTLKSLEIKKCEIQVLQVDEAKNLDTLTYDVGPASSQHLQYFDFFYGHLNAKVSVKAVEARILVEELFDKEWFSSNNSTHFPMLMTFLKRFRCCREIKLYNQDVRALIVPKNYRKMTSISPLPESSILKVRMPKTLIEGSRDYLELMDSLQWIAPSARISVKLVDFEEDKRLIIDDRA